MRNPEQICIPGTEPVRGPCDDALTAWQDSMEAAAEAAAEKKRKRDELLDCMQQTGTSRVAYVDRKTQKRKWLEITADPKLRTVAAEQDGEPGGGTERPRGRRTARSTETPDPFAATREALAADPAGLPENGSGLPVARSDGQNASPGHRNAHGSAGESVDGDGEAESQSDRLLRPGQRRRARGVR